MPWSEGEGDFTLLLLGVICRASTAGDGGLCPPTTPKARNFDKLTFSRLYKFTFRGNCITENRRVASGVRGAGVAGSRPYDNRYDLV